MSGVVGILNQASIKQGIKYALGAGTFYIGAKLSMMRQEERFIRSMTKILQEMGFPRSIGSHLPARKLHLF
jgi:hypothetical protein